MMRARGSPSSDNLLTLDIRVSCKNKTIYGKALLDPGSSVSTISSSKADELEVRIQPANIIIETANGRTNVGGLTDFVEVNVAGHVCELPMYVVDHRYDFIFGLN